MGAHDAPCRDCTKRCFMCHSNCRAYLEWRAWNSERLKAIARARELNEYEQSRARKWKKWKEGHK